MQLTTVSRLCSLFLVQCILTICVQTAPAITAKLLRDLQKRQLEENETKNESEETAVVVHNYAKSIQRNRQFWQRRNCDLDFHCAPVAIQHCTNQIGKLTSQEACKFYLFIICSIEKDKIFQVLGYYVINHVFCS